MPTPGPSAASQSAASAAAWISRRLAWVLLACYAAAALLPAPGVWLSDLGSGGPVRFSLAMVGVLLFCGAAGVELGRLRELPRRPGGLGLGLFGVWAPALAVVAVWSRLSDACLGPEVAAPITVGLALAAAMPVANSAVAWAHQSRGSLVWALGLVLLSITLCPWVTPALLRLAGIALSGAGASAADQALGRFGGVVFVVGVLAPTVLGLAVRAAVGARRSAVAAPWLAIASASALLLLNYANASTALPRVLDHSRWPVLALTLVAAATLPLAGTLCAWPLAVAARVGARGRVAWMYALGMKNTGLALGLAGATLGDRPLAVLAILAVTLLQHLVAAGVHLLVVSPSDDAEGG